MAVDEVRRRQRTLELMEPSLAAFLGIAVLVIVTPGPDTALTIGNTLGGGRQGGLGTALGVASGQAVWTVGHERRYRRATRRVDIGVRGDPARRRGLSRVARRAGPVGRPERGDSEAGPAGDPPVHSTPLPWWAAFRQGVLSNLGNPKMAVFFTSLLPQFAPAGRAGLFGASRARPPVLRDDAGLAGRLRRRGRAGGRRSAPVRRAARHRGRDRIRSPGPWACASRSIAASRPATAGASVARGPGSAVGPGLIDRVQWAGYPRTRDGAVPSRARQDRRRHLMKGGSCAIGSP